MKLINGELRNQMMIVCSVALGILLFSSNTQAQSGQDSITYQSQTQTTTTTTTQSVDVDTDYDRKSPPVPHIIGPRRQAGPIEIRLPLQLRLAQKWSGLP